MGDCWPQTPGQITAAWVGEQHGMVGRDAFFSSPHLSVSCLSLSLKHLLLSCKLVVCVPFGVDVGIWKRQAFLYTRK